MSREIKFRAWNGETMISPDYITRDGVGHWKEDSIPTSSKKIMQYTGLKDCNGVEIYEGDLLRIPPKNQYEETTYNCFEVFYHDNDCIGGQNIGFCMNRMHKQGHSAGGHGYRFTPDSIRHHGFVVIGNIYKNPELLEGA